jgi:hypothetical protein
VLRAAPKVPKYPRTLFAVTHDDKRVEAEKQFAALTLPPNTLPTVAASRDRDREARIRHGLPLIDWTKRATAETEEA